MLDKILCEAANIDPFMQQIMEKLERAEDRVYRIDITPLQYIEAKAEYETLKQIRDLYSEYVQNNDHKNNKKIEKVLLNS